MPPKGKLARRDRRPDCLGEMRRAWPDGDRLRFRHPRAVGVEGHRADILGVRAGRKAVARGRGMLRWPQYAIDRFILADWRRRG